MKLSTSSFLFLLLLIVLSCGKEDYVTDYPEIVSSHITNITKNGIDLDGTLGGGPRDKITDHGFIWWVTNDISIHHGVVVSLGKPDGVSSTFSTNIEWPYYPSVTYYVRAYVQTNDIVVYGELMSFDTMGPY